MSFVLPAGLAPEVYPLAWLVGEWHGPGVVAYPGVPATSFTQRLSITNDGGPYLAYTSTMQLADEPAPGPVWADERGYWRVPPERPDDLPVDRYPVEVLLADPSGYVAVYVGAVGEGRIDLVSDLVARTATGADVTAGRRLYGLVEGELMWVHELAAFGHPLQSYASARLVRVQAS